jgi:hypothetical protein
MSSALFKTAARGIPNFSAEEKWLSEGAQSVDSSDFRALTFFSFLIELSLREERVRAVSACPVESGGIPVDILSFRFLSRSYSFRFSCADVRGIPVDVAPATNASVTTVAANSGATPAAINCETSPAITVSTPNFCRLPKPHPIPRRPRHDRQPIASRSRTCSGARSPRHANCV